MNCKSRLDGGICRVKVKASPGSKPLALQPKADSSC